MIYTGFDGDDIPMGIPHEELGLSTDLTFKFSRHKGGINMKSFEGSEPILKKKIKVIEKPKRKPKSNGKHLF